MDFLTINKQRHTTNDFLSKNVTPILAPVVTACILEQPRDVAGFLAKAFASQSGHTIKSPKKKQETASDADGVEMDTAGSETLSDNDLWSLLLPNATMPGLSHPTITKFSISYSSALLSGWVKQRSPGCAAASVAGAFNALRDLQRNEAGALSMDDVIGTLCEIQQGRAEKKRGRIERFLLGASLEPLSVLLREYIFKHHDGKTLAGENKATCCGKKIRNAALKKLVHLRYKIIPTEVTPTTEATTASCSTATTTATTSSATSTENNASESNETIVSLTTATKNNTSVSESKYSTQNEMEEDESNYEISSKVTDVPKEAWVHQASVFVQIRELIEMKEQEQMEENASAQLLRVGTTPLAAAEEDNEEDGGGEDGEEGEEGEEKSTSTTKKSSSKSSTDDFNWLKEMKSYFEIVTGLEKLQRKKPSTSAFGNWGIVAAVRECSLSDENGNFKANYFMGRGAKGKVQCRLSPSDTSEAELERTFQMLKLEHSHPNAVLLSHHKNHYALIYAVRDWVEKIPIEKEEENEESENRFVTEGKNIENEEDADASESENGITTKKIQIQKYRKKRVRQVLTARRGQRPSVWMDWEELRGVYLKWSGYKLMSIRYNAFQNNSSSSNGYSVGMRK